MSWERDPLWAKARLYCERAFAQPRDDPQFGLWCSLALELLARAALASISPTLLAEPDPSQNNLLYALNRGSEKPPRSITNQQVFILCRRLFDEFSEADRKAAVALASRRNDELHSGSSAFDEYPPAHWLTDFYRICCVLTRAMGESLENLFGADEAGVAERVLRETQAEVRQGVAKRIGIHRGTFEAKSEAERRAASESAEREGSRLAHERRHRVKCPACGSVATVQGELFGPERVAHEGDVIKVQQAVSPRTFRCLACGLSLESYAELEAARLGGSYTRTTTFSPEDYYGLVDPASIDQEKIIQDYLEGLAADAAYDNE